MKKNIVRILMIVIILIVTTGCPDKGKIPADMKFINKSAEEDIFVSFNFPDTILPLQKWGKSIKKGEFVTINFVRLTGTARFFILNLDTVNKYPWEIIRSEKKYIKNCDFTSEELDRMNWTINYP